MNKRQETTFFQNKVTLLGNKIEVGQKAPNFTALNNELKFVQLNDFKDKVILISSVPSLDTGVCQMQTVRFNKEVEQIKGLKVITISCDLPFAQSRFCTSFNTNNVVTLSDHKDLDFGLKYGCAIEELRLLNRAIFVIDKNGIIQYVEYVKENTDHPNYDKALKCVKNII